MSLFARLCYQLAMFTLIFTSEVLCVIQSFEGPTLLHLFSINSRLVISESTQMNHLRYSTQNKLSCKSTQCFTSQRTIPNFNASVVLKSNVWSYTLTYRALMAT